MRKREFLKSLAAALFVVPASWRVATSRTPREVWGPVDVERHRALCMRGTHLHIYHFNQDVSTRCRFFDDTPGQERAELHLLNDKGRPYLAPDRDGPAIEVITNFVVRRGDPFN
jgi:hypothetical protein